MCQKYFLKNMKREARRGEGRGSMRRSQSLQSATWVPLHVRELSYLGFFFSFSHESSSFSICLFPFLPFCPWIPSWASWVRHIFDWFWPQKKCRVVRAHIYYGGLTKRNSAKITDSAIMKIYGHCECGCSIIFLFFFPFHRKNRSDKIAYWGGGGVESQRWKNSVLLCCVCAGCCNIFLLETPSVHTLIKKKKKSQSSISLYKSLLYLKLQFRIISFWLLKLIMAGR